MGKLRIYYKLLQKYHEWALQVPKSDTKNKVREWNMLLDKIRDIALWSCGFTTSLEGMLVTMKKQNDFGLSSCTVPQSPIACVIVYFGVVECCSKKR